MHAYNSYIRFNNALLQNTTLQSIVHLHILHTREKKNKTLLLRYFSRNNSDEAMAATRKIKTDKLPAGAESPIPFPAEKCTLALHR